MKKISIWRKTASIFVSFSMLLNGFSPFVSTAYSEDLSPTPTPEPVNNEQIVTPTPIADQISMTPANLEPIVTEVPIEIPSEDLLPTVNPVPTPTPVTEIEKECLTNQEIISTTNDNWNIDLTNGSAETNEKVKLGVKYLFPQENRVSVTFKCLPKDESLRTGLKIQQIKISDLKLPSGVNPAGDFAYDITTGMNDGTFEYDVTLPKAEDQSANVSYIEKSADEVKNQSEALKTEDIKPVDEGKLNQDGDKVTASGIDHFTIWIVEKSLSLTGSLNGWSQIVVSPNETIKVTLEVGTWSLLSDHYDDWESSQYLIEGGSWTCVDTANHNNDGNHTETFNINAPSSVGTYDISFRAYNNESCTGPVSSNSSLADGIIVSSCPAGALFCDDFESNLSKWDVLNGDFYTNDSSSFRRSCPGDFSSCAADGHNHYSAVRNDGSLIKNISTTDIGDLTLSYWRRADDLESSDNDNLQVSWRVGSSGSWTILESTRSNSWSKQTWTLTGSGDKSNIQIKIGLVASSDHDYALFDDVLVLGNVLPVCSDGIKNGSEECDGTDGVTEGLTCNGRCELEYIERKVDICHSTSSQTNPYNLESPNKSADVSGHDGHNGPVWYTGITMNWGDIIPPFNYIGGSYPGKNWTTEGQAIYNNGCHIDICGNGSIETGEQCDDGNQVDNDSCTNQCQFNPVRIKAYKVVCDNEADLPNGTQGSIDQNTAQDWVNSHPTCRLESQWAFQYAGAGAGSFGAFQTNTSSLSSPWTTFEVGNDAVINDLSNFGSRIEVREIFPTNYSPLVPFSNSSNNVSAEIYCTGDAAGYDNWEWLNNLQYGNTYYCVAFNAPNKGTITIHKNVESVNNDDSSVEFHFDITKEGDTNPTAELNVSKNSPQTAEVLAGTYSISEVIPDAIKDAWIGRSATCTKESDPTHLITNLSSLIVNPNDKIDCTWGNSKKAEIAWYKIDANLAPEQSVGGHILAANTWSSTVDGEAGPMNMNSSDPHNNPGTYNHIYVEAGQHSLAEVTQDGWNFAWGRCQDMTNSVPGGWGTNVDIDFSQEGMQQTFGPKAPNFVTGFGTLGTSSNNYADINLSAGQRVYCVLYNEQHGSIIAHKYVDNNRNGVLDTGEVDKEGWLMSLYNGETCSGTAIDSGLTDANGDKTFGNLPFGKYSVSEEARLGWENENNLCQSINLNTDVPQTINYGNFEYGEIQGRKYNDLNQDGNRDAGEAYLSNWTIRMYVRDGAGGWSGPTNHTTGETGTLGQYRFENLSPGTYYVCEVLQNGWNQVSPVIGTNRIANQSPNKAEEGNVCWKVVINRSSQSVTGRHFGNIHYGSILAHKFEDVNGNGSIDSNEGGLSDWEMGVYNGSSCSGPVISNGFKNTDNNGDAQFDNLVAGNYSVKETEQTDWQRTTPECQDVTVVPGQTAPVNVGNRKLYPNLTITKTVADSIINRNTDFEFTLTASNSGETVARGTSIHDDLPSGFSYVPGSTTGANEPTVIGQTLSWGLFDIAVGDQIVITFRATAPDELLDGENCASTRARNNQTEAWVNSCTRIKTEAPAISITKSNNTTGKISLGTIVTYTIKVTNTNQNVLLYKTKVLDAHPFKASYIAGSATAVSNIHDPFITAEPICNNYTCNWTLGTLSESETVTLTYQLKINSAPLSGIYWNIAFANGHDSPNSNIINSEIVESPIEIDKALAYSTNVSPGESSVLGASTGPAVLGASTELPGTGANFGLTLVELLALVGALVLRKKLMKKSKYLKRKVLGLIFALVLTGLSFRSVNAVEEVIPTPENSVCKIDINNLNTLVNTSNITISYVTLDTNEDASLSKVEFNYRKDGGSNQIVTVNTADLSGEKAIEIGDQGKFYFSAKAYYSNEDTCSSAEASTTIDTTGPNPLDSFGFSRKDGSSTAYEICFKTPGDSDVAHVKIYRSDVEDFTADSSTEIHTEDIGPSTNRCWTNDGLESGKTYYYAARVIDEAGNASNPSYFNKIIIEENPNISAGTTNQGGLAVNNVISTGSVLGELSDNLTITPTKTQDKKEEITNGNGQVLGESQKPKTKSSLIFLIIGGIVLIVIIVYFLLRKKQE